MAGEAPRTAAPAATTGAPSAPSGERIPGPGERIPGPGETPAAAPADDSGKVVKDSSFAVALEAPGEVQSGAEAVASVKITPGSGYKMNQEYPTKLTLLPTDGVTPAKATLGKGDAAKFDNHELAFNVKLTAARAGTYTVRGTVAFAVCTENTCDPKTEKIAINFVAK